MFMGWEVVLIAAILLGYALVSQRLAGSPLTSPMVFVSLGFLMGSEAFDLIETSIESEDLLLLAEVALALLLFSDAASLNTRRLQHESGVPLRLLGLALPLTIVAGAGVAAVAFPDLTLFEAVILGVLLAPTDAALGKSVVSDTRIPSTVRQGLNVESGLNDGVCVPLLVAAVTFAQLDEAPTFNGQILVDLVEELAIAFAVGTAVAVAVATISKLSIRRGWIEASWGLIVPLAATAAAYTATIELGGSGFIASFVAGLIYGRLLGATAHHSTMLTEELGTLLSSVTFLLFGVVMVSRIVSGLDAATIIYAVLSLTVIRMAPVAISLLGSGARRETSAFIGWFGPRGLATIVFALTIVGESGLTGTRQIVDVATFTVVLSIFAHGLSAPSLIDRYVKWFTTNQNQLTLETQTVPIGSHTRPPRPKWPQGSEHD
jgi:NhaP-type Na+/H+ or K+/H+ antiporter